MDIKFVGGPYDGMEIDHRVVNEYAQQTAVPFGVGLRLFVSMPPREVWDRLLRGERVEGGPSYLYEEFTGDSRTWLELAAPDAIQRAQSENRLKLHSRAQTALGALSYAERRQVLEAADALQHEEPARWSEDKVVKLSTDEPLYLLRVSPELRAIIRTPEPGIVQLDDIVRRETLELFGKQQEVGVPK